MLYQSGEADSQVPGLIEQHVGCPYCGEIIDILVDDSEPEQQYVEDCQVCCRPILFRLQFGADGSLIVEVSREDD